MDEYENYNLLERNEESLEERFKDYLKGDTETRTGNGNNLINNNISFKKEVPPILKDNKDNNDYRCNMCLFFPYIEIKDKNTMNYFCKCTNYKRKQIPVKDFFNDIINFQKKNKGGYFPIKMCQS